jgi:translation initiation factor 5B
MNKHIGTTSQPKKQFIVEEIKEYEYDKSLKSPVISVMGHVDAGKSSLINIIKNINITDEEAGGITQSINSYFIKIDDIVDITKNITGKFKVEPKVPGILCIDTPGHMAFNKIREQSTLLCDIAIVVVDLMDGLKPQTKESIEMLKKNKIPFIVAATKIDRINGYEMTDNLSLKDALQVQDKNVKVLIEAYINDMKYELEQLGVKAEFYFKNKKPQSIYSIVPISNKSKEGLADLLSLIIFMTENWMGKKITYSDEVIGTIMNNYNDKKDGWIIDLILKNGTINVGDKYAVMSTEGSKSITIRNLIVDNKYIKSVRASRGVKIIASNSANIYSGTNIVKINKNSNLKKVLYDIESNFNKLWDSFKLKKNGICIMAETFGQMDALHRVFAQVNISHVDIGSITEKNINKVKSIVEENTDKENKCFIYFGKLTEKEKDNLTKYCKNLDMMFISNDVVYQLLDDYKKYREECLEDRQKELVKKGEAVYPCRMKIYKQHIYMKGGADNIMLGVKVREGKVRIGMPINYSVYCDDTKNVIKSEKEPYLGIITSLQKNNEDIEEANGGDDVCIRFDNPEGLLYGRHFSHTNKLISKLSRKSIDVLKKDYRDKMTRKDWEMVVELKKELNIV